MVKTFTKEEKKEELSEFKAMALGFPVLLFLPLELRWVISLFLYQ